MKVFYAVSTHWDREWYKPFQGFRYDLVKVTDNIINSLENGDIDQFTFDGQTIVLEDYLEIKPENREKITKLIKDGKLRVGPWYVMPDELLVSGESIIRNFLTGKEEAEKFGGSTWKYGYMNDIFGHVAQMPQILNGFGIKAVYLGRGVSGENQNFKNFVWKSPDGSMCLGYKDVYAQLMRALKKAEDKKEALNTYISENSDKTGNVILMYTDDHTDINQNTFEFVKLAKEMGFSPMVEEITDHTDTTDLPVETGELVTTAQKPGSFRVVTSSLSSYYPLKYENDYCENLLENKISPMLAMAKASDINLNPNYLKLAYRYLLKNQPHDSICGCSSDTVHSDMAYRYSQVKSICKALESDFENNITSNGEEYCFSVMNYDTKKYEGVFITELRIDKNCALFAKDNAGYQEYLAFDIEDEKGNKIPYEILSIQKNYLEPERPYIPIADKYTIAMYGKLNSFGKTTFRLIAEKPEYTPAPFSDGGLWAENEFLKLEISADGSVGITDKQTGRKYEGLNTFTDDGEMGNGWFSERPVSCNTTITSAGAKTKIEILIKSELITKFRVTKYMSVPQCADYVNMSRSENDSEIKIVSDISLKKNSKTVEFETTVFNTAKDHRLRAEFPVRAEGDSYYASQAFTFIKRSRGVSHTGLNSSEPELCEKNTGGIICVKDSKGGLSFVGKEGFHHCGVSKDGVISATMLRCFGRMMWSAIPTEKAQLLGKHTFRYALTTETDFAKLYNMKKILFGTYSNVKSDHFSSCELIEIEETAAVSLVKPSENSNGLIIRLFNPAESEIDCSIGINLPVKEIYKTSLDEEQREVLLTLENNKLNIKISPYKIETIYIGIK